MPTLILRGRGGVGVRDRRGPKRSLVRKVFRHTVTQNFPLHVPRHLEERSVRVLQLRLRVSLGRGHIRPVKRTVC